MHTKNGHRHLLHSENIWRSRWCLGRDPDPKRSLTSSEPPERSRAAPMPGKWTGVAGDLGKNRKTCRGWVWDSEILDFCVFSAKISRFGPGQPTTRLQTLPNPARRVPKWTSEVWELSKTQKTNRGPISDSENLDFGRLAFYGLGGFPGDRRRQIFF